MKVLFVFKESTGVNSFVYTLRDALLAENIEVKCSVEDFWQNYEAYDIIHFHWIEWHLKIIDGKDVDDVIKQINRIREKRKIIVTCHNLKPHYSADYYGGIALNYIYEHCDAMIHLGQYSYDYFKNKLDAQIKHYIIPHHIYDNLYHFSMDKSVARNHLKIPLDANVLLCFGSFRNDIERNMVLKAWRQIKLKNKYLLAPGFYILNKRRKNKVFLYMQMLKVLYYKLIGIPLTNRFIPDNMVETYLCAADILMIQRAFILNSGNLSLGFHAQKVVVGPNVGNIKEILETTGNPVFDPADRSSVAKAIQEGFRLKDTDLPQKNYDFAMTNWSVSAIARKHIDVYQELI